MLILYYLCTLNILNVDKYQSLFNCKSYVDVVISLIFSQIFLIDEKKMSKWMVIYVKFDYLMLLYFVDVSFLV